MSDREIIKVLECLIGKTSAIGNTVVDESRTENLKTLIGVVDWCIDVVRDSAENCGHEFSIMENASTANDALEVWFGVIRDALRGREKHERDLSVGNT